MKLLIFGLSGLYGGVESFIISQVSALSRFDSSIRFDFIVFDEIPQYLDRLRIQSDINVYVVPSRWRHPFKYALMLDRLFKENSFDLLWYNVCTLSDISLLRCAYHHQIPCVVHSHNSENMGSWINGLLHQVNRRIVSRLEVKYLACSDSAGRFMFPDWGRNEHGEAVVPNAIDVGRFAFSPAIRHSVRVQMGLKEDDVLFGNVGRLHHQKNQLFLLDIFQVIRERMSSAKLLIVGSGSLESCLRERAASIGDGKQVIFITDCTDTAKYYSAMDCFLFPSLFEGFGIAALEAQCSGLPCVVSTGVSSDVDILDTVKRVSLGSSAGEWAEAAITASKMSTVGYRKEAWHVLSNTRFNLENSIPHLAAMLADCSHDSR